MASNPTYSWDSFLRSINASQKTTENGKILANSHTSFFKDNDFDSLFLVGFWIKYDKN